MADKSPPDPAPPPPASHAFPIHSRARFRRFPLKCRIRVCPWLVELCSRLFLNDTVRISRKLASLDCNFTSLHFTHVVGWKPETIDTTRRALYTCSAIGTNKCLGGPPAAWASRVALPLASTPTSPNAPSGSSDTVIRLQYMYIDDIWTFVWIRWATVLLMTASHPAHHLYSNSPSPLVGSCPLEADGRYRTLF